MENKNINKENNNNQSQNQIDLNQSSNTKDILEKVKENLYNAMCFYWDDLPEDYKISTLLDPRIKSVNEEVEKDDEILCQKYDEYQYHLQSPIESRPVSPTQSEYSTITSSLVLSSSAVGVVDDEVSAPCVGQGNPFFLSTVHGCPGYFLPYIFLYFYFYKSTMDTMDTMDI